MSGRLTFREFVAQLLWLDGRPLADVIEPYRWRIFDQAFERETPNSLQYRHNLILAGRAKKNWKTADAVIACLFAVLDDSPGGNQVYLVANDGGQAQDDLELAKKIIAVNPALQAVLVVRKNDVIERRDGKGFIEVLAAGDAVGSHGKTYRLLVVDEVHGHRNWDLLEALAMDPTRPDAQQWFTSYASLFHKPGAPLFDMLQCGRTGTDPRMLLAWYAADFTTDPELADAAPEDRANPSRRSFTPGYLEQQRRRLPAHKFRRLHLNLPGLPEGSAFQPEPIFAAVARGVKVRLREQHLEYRAFVDMSGGSSDDAVLAIGHLDGERAVVDRVENQGPPPPFDPELAVGRFADILREYGLSSVTGDRYAGETFRAAFERHDIHYETATQTRSQLYEAFMPWLNGDRVVLVDESTLEQQFLGLIWRGGKIDHVVGQHDDWSNAAAGVVVELLGDASSEGRGMLAFAIQQVKAAQAETVTVHGSQERCPGCGDDVFVRRGIHDAAGERELRECTTCGISTAIEETENPWIVDDPMFDKDRLAR